MLQQLDAKQGQEHGHRVVHAGFQLQRAGHAGIDRRSAAMQQHEDGGGIGRGDHRAQQHALQRREAHGQVCDPGDGEGREQHADGRQAEGRPEHQPHHVARRPEPALEQNDGQGDRADREGRAVVVEVDLEDAVLAGQHAEEQEDQQQRRAEPRGNHARENAEQDQQRADEDELIDEIHAALRPFTYVNGRPGQPSQQKMR